MVHTIDAVITSGRNLMPYEMNADGLRGATVGGLTLKVDTLGKAKPLTVTTTPLSCRHVRTAKGLPAETPVKLKTGRIVEDRIVLRL